MLEAGRSQIVIYVVIAAVLLLVGFNSIRSDSGSAERETTTFGTGNDAGGGSASTGDADGGAGSGLEVAASGSKLVVDVSGGVRDPGVYRLAPGTRVIDAIRIAGGVIPQALPGAINRAAKLADGQQVVVPVMAGGAAGGVVGPAGGTVAGAADVPISLGSATPEQLEEIDGIGPVTAGQIIEFRDSQGGLGSVDELDQVSGIGPVTMEALRSALQP